MVAVAWIAARRPPLESRDGDEAVRDGRRRVRRSRRESRPRSHVQGRGTRSGRSVGRSPRRSTLPAPRRTRGSCRSTPPATATTRVTAASSRRTIRSRRSRRSREAYRIEWLVIERDDAVPALGPVFAGEARPPLDRPAAHRRSPGPDGETSADGLPGLRQPRRPALRCDRRREGGTVSRREILLSAAARLRRRARRRAVVPRRSSSSRSRRTPPTTSASPATFSRATG